MGLSLRNIKKKINEVAGGVGRQVNPFDGGATYRNPVSRPSRPQAPIQRGFGSNMPFGGNVINGIQRGGLAQPQVRNKPMNSVQIGALNVNRSADPTTVNIAAMVNKPYETPGVIKHIVRPILRSAPHLATLFTHKAYTPGKGIEQGLFGKEKVSTYTERQRGIEKNFQSKGGILENLATPLSVGANIANVAFDATAFTGIKQVGKAGARQGLGAADAAVVKMAPTVTKAGQKIAPVINKVTGGLDAPIAGMKTAPAPPAKPTIVPNAPKTTVKAPPRPKVNATVNDRLDHLVNTKIDSSTPDFGNSNPVTKYVTKQTERLYRQPIDRFRDRTSDAILGLQSSDNALVSKVSAAPNLIFNRFGQKDAVRSVFRERDGAQENAGRVVTQLTNQLGDKLAALDDSEGSLRRLQNYFFDADIHKRAFPGEKKIGYKQLSTQEREIVDEMQEYAKIRNDSNLKTQVIDKKQHKQESAGRHTPRIMDFKGRNSKDGRATNLIDKSAGIKRKDASKFDQATIDSMEKNPIMAHMVRLEQALRNEATQDAITKLEKSNLVRKNAPKNNTNYTRLDGPQYGNHNGKYILNAAKSELDRNIQYNKNGVGAGLGELIDRYQNTFMGDLDRFFKSTKTTLNPGTFLGNVVSNPVAFNSAAGVNGLTQAKNMVKAGVKLRNDATGKSFDKSLYEARQKGVGVNDTGKQLTGDRRAEGLTIDRKKTKNPVKLAGKVYGGADQAAQVALYDELRKRGLDAATAARRVGNGTQDYGNAGRLIHNIADSPVLGKPFARFTPELLRLTKNNIIYNPVGTGAKVAGVAGAQNYLSKKSGETPQERDTRQNAPGQTNIPYTGWIDDAINGKDAGRNLSLNFPTPKGTPVIGEGQVNIARLTGLNYPMEPNGTPKTALRDQLIPLANPTRRNAEGKIVFAPNEVASSLTVRPLADQAVNRDFMGRTITDPTNRTNVEGVGELGRQKAGAPSAEEQRNNRLRALGAAYTPLFNESNAILSARNNEKAKKEGKDPVKDYYGKDRTLTQAVLRGVGVKVENNDKKARDKRVQNEEFFEGKLPQVQKFLRDNPTLKGDYVKLTSKTTTRDGTERINDTISPEKWSIIKNKPKLYEQLRTEAYYSNKHNKDKNGKGQPIDPIYEVKDPAKRKEILELRSLPTGNGQETTEIARATKPWFKQYEKQERTFYKEQSAFFDNLPKRDGKAPPKQNPRVKAYNDVPHPEQPTMLANYYKLRYGDEETGKIGNEAAGKAYYKANADALQGLTKGYKSDRLKEVNAKRKIEGADPISETTWNNVTFGYEDDEAKVAKELYFKGYGGYGRGGGGGKKEYNPNSEYTDPYGATIARGSRASMPKPKITIKDIDLRAKNKGASRPKVSMKVTKSRV